ncbi:NAD-P-binding protein [Trametes versicolor FP-101664 SS1]|uniref:NAD-P-binding protein n=1 Tax=Trametes versicolor (strain FP-101664) TaxID=717944 RepID=UPI0004622D72|nr:NAD-P-binding protein [Trametes versicolor FP-101664 SS1]EIW60167.1 NAD-P-binding protein [Trametes versicolor FP-101664 SS1]
MSPITWLVTGANRGIGLELVKQLVAVPTNVVVAACRNPDKATALAELKSSAKGTLHLVQLDVSDFDNIRALPKQLEAILGSTGLDYLISNAGIAIFDTAFTLDPEALLNVVRTNAAGPALLSQVVLPFLEKAPTKKILHVSSTAGSIASVAQLPPAFMSNASYPISKAALNMLVYKQKVERPDLTVITLCPGWVQTDMGGADAALKPEESVAGIIKVITNATKADSGKYLRHTGEEIPW